MADVAQETEGVPVTDDADRPSGIEGVLGKVKEVVAKATQAVAGIVKKNDAPAGATGATASGEPTERSKKMKDAVEQARKTKDDD